LKKITLLALLLASMPSFSQIVNTAPYILTIPELKEWTENGPTASADLIATIPLAPRFSNPQTQFNPALTNDMQIAYLPDGMNNFGNYFGEQNQFNLYNFTHWAYIDKFVWFGGTSTQTIQIPSSPWANAAHKNGVKIFGDVFFSPTAFGGSTATLQSFLEKDANGNFIVLPKMIAIMQYYKFDGWFINQETATTPAVAVLMQEFVKKLTAEAEALGKEIMWYDAMILNGNVGWQNRLNANNSPFLQNDADGNAENGFEERVSSSMFINFFWSSASYPNASRTRATAIGRSSFDVFTGMDIWPGRNQGNFATTGNTYMARLHENTTNPITSLGLFAPNCVYNSSVFTNFNNDPTDVDSFYDAENHLFAGADLNPGIIDATGFKGLSAWVPETTVVTGSFSTNFNTGHGTKKFHAGAVESSEPWHDMNKQDILPTWQWAFSQSGILSAKWDFDKAFSGGSSLKISGNLPANNPIDLMLYKTKINLSDESTNPGTMLGYITENMSNPGVKMLVVYADEPNQKHEISLSEPVWMDIFNEWGFASGSLAGNQSREIAEIGLRFVSDTAIPNYEINFGELDITDVVLLQTATAANKTTAVTVIYPQHGNVSFVTNWPNNSSVNYKICDLQGKIAHSGNIDNAKNTTFSLPVQNLSKGTYVVTFSDKNNITETRKIIVK